MRVGLLVVVALLLVNASPVVNGTGSQSEEEATAPSGQDWPPIDEALIRPGVQIHTEGRGWCTSNFVFTDAENNIYLGTAAHCVHDSIGANVRLQSDPDFHTGEVGPVIGNVWYSARVYESVWSEPCVSVGPVQLLSCSMGPGNSANDFALIKINDEWKHTVHPAVLHYGGPTEIAAADSIEINDPVLTYGNSPLRPGPTPLDAREGFIQSTSQPWLARACIITSGVPGDSGSAVLSGEGEALGVLITLGVAAPCGAINGITILETALEFAREKGYDVELATWDLLNGPMLP
jgi:hypothetical protein